MVIESSVKSNPPTKKIFVELSHWEETRRERGQIQTAKQKQMKKKVQP